jgi:hypothetical protein
MWQIFPASLSLAVAHCVYLSTFLSLRAVPDVCPFMLAALDCKSLLPFQAVWSDKQPWYCAHGRWWAVLLEKRGRR